MRLQVSRVSSAELDAEVRAIMRRVFGVEPISYGGRLIVASGPPTALERLRQSVAEVQQRTAELPLQLTGGAAGAPLSDWLDQFVRDHEERRSKHDRCEFHGLTVSKRDA